MHAHQLILKTMLKSIYRNGKMVQFATAAASAAALRQELRCQCNRLDATEAQLMQIVSRRGWDLSCCTLFIPDKNMRLLRSGNLCDCVIAEIIIRNYCDALIRELKQLHSLPYPDEPICTAVERNRDFYLGCIYRLLPYL